MAAKRSAFPRGASSSIAPETCSVRARLPKPTSLSTHGTILSINLRDSLHFLTSVAGFFLPHLHYRGLLKDQGFYTIDMEGLFRRDRVAWVAAANAQAYLTQALAVRTLPLSLLDRCGLDFDRWFPLPAGCPPCSR